MPAKRVDPMREEKRVAIKLISYYVSGVGKVDLKEDTV
jgi:hypothetical protein